MSFSKMTRNADGTLNVPDHVVIPFIEGDGTGPDIWRAAKLVMDSAVQTAYQGKREISWLQMDAGETGFQKTGEWLPAKTLETIREYLVAIKGPLTTPVGKGIRSLNVAIRQELDLYACIRPVQYIEPVPSPMKHPEKVNMVIFRENTEDLYAGIEWESGSEEAKRLISFLKQTLGAEVLPESGVGIKPMSPKNSKRLVAFAISYAIENQLPSVTMMHKGNIMKFTEGAFSKWGYEAAKEKFGDKVITESELTETYKGVRPEGKVVIRDRIADMLFQQVLLRPEEFSVIATPNLNGDYLSDAVAAQVGGLGMAPGANIGDHYAVFEATHGTAPKYANLDKVNPGSVMLSGAMMFDYIGWKEAAHLIRSGIAYTIRSGTVTYDLARQIKGAKEVRCSEFAQAVADNFKNV